MRELLFCLQPIVVEGNRISGQSGKFLQENKYEKSVSMPGNGIDGFSMGDGG
jgi:hypothetical protein